MTPEAKADVWLNSQQLDQESAQLIRNLKAGNEIEFIDSFYKDLEFGTGGLRGIMGVGSNRMNKYTVGMATQGLANYLKSNFQNQEISVAIAHDSRNNSRYFAEVTAGVFSANEIKVYLFDSLRPTPELSFAIRHLGCQSGVVLTASHNPKEYNGYKAYWDDGAQLVSPHDENVINEVKAITSIDEVKFQSKNSLIHEIGEELDEVYLKMIEGLSLSPEAIRAQNDLKIVFSSIHGTGITLVPPILKRLGFTQVHIVKEQANADGDFPTVVYPNPEEAEALSLAIKQAEDINADLVMATDPDSDRVGIAVKNLDGKFQLLNGNQTGSLLMYYLLKKWSENGKLTGHQFIVKTIVTSELIKAVAEGFKVKSYDTLTGFKFIAALIKELEGKEEFIGGGEESYGYLIGDKVRDKDAIASSAMIAEMTAWAKNEGKSLFELLIDISIEFGLFQEGLKSVTKKGKSGAEEIQEMMKGFRINPPSHLDGSEVLTLIDYQSGTSTDLKSGSVSSIKFPNSNVLQFITDDGTKVSVRPSGTEPKIKFYFSVNQKISNMNEYFEGVNYLSSKIDRLIQQMEQF
ncbi:MAG: phospho-sugar mutase [Cyclobacteriaceae bacterium]